MSIAAVYPAIHIYGRLICRGDKLHYTMYESIYVSIQNHIPNAIKGMGMRESVTKAMKRKHDKRRQR